MPDPVTTAPTSTYRLQIRAAFPLDAAADQVDYLRALGAAAAYLSPLLKAADGSDHGYDVTDHSRVDPDRGGPAGLTRFVERAHAEHLEVVVDVVPNHAGVADARQNAPWWDVLRLGQASPYAQWFDIEWSRGKLLIPILGDDFDPGHDLRIVGDELRYHDHRFPIAPGSVLPGDSPADVLDRQHYELGSYHLEDTDQHYRRFFAVTTLAGLRVEDEPVFDGTHAEVLRWIREDGVSGLRLDHPDGLADPAGYLARLRDRVGPNCWITVEKILEPGEQLPPEWPVAGTTGYDALTEVTNALVDSSHEAAFDEIYQEITGDPLDFHEHVQRGKRTVASTILQAEVARLARLAPDVGHARDALRELLVQFPVYRSYLPGGAEYLNQAAAAARSVRPDLAGAIGDLLPRLSDPGDELCVRFQQTSGAVMAKGVEDTAYYRYNRFIVLNEVGGDPASFGRPTAEFHAAQVARQQLHPRSMTTLSTHDTKRGEDVRARLLALSEFPREWAGTIRTLIEKAPIPSKTFAYLLWQTFVGAGFIEPERMHAYAEKAMREAADGTSWADPDAAFESAVHEAVDGAYDRPAIHEPLADLIRTLTPYARITSLSQKLIQLTMPGVPDVYQGCELWEDSLVDPDNRRPIDFDLRRRLLEALPGYGCDGVLPTLAADDVGISKLLVVQRALTARRERPELFGGYSQLIADGPAADNLLAFDRGGAVALATRLPVALDRSGGWRSTGLTLHGSYTDAFSGARHTGRINVGDALAALPVALLLRD